MVREVHVSRRLSAPFVFSLLSEHPDLERIVVPPSVYRITSSRVLDALKRTGVEVIVRARRGRPPKYSEETIKKVVEYYRRGVPARKISTNLGIPIRTVYHILRSRGVSCVLSNTRRLR